GVTTITTTSAPPMAIRLSFLKVFIVLALVIGFGLALVLRGTARHGGTGRGNWWPALAIVPLLGLFFLGTVRYSVNRQITGPAMEVPQPMPVPSDLEAKLRQEISHGDIHMLMDRTD